MNKDDVINVIESLNFSKGEYYVVLETALVLYEIKQYCDLVNLCVSEELFRELKDAGKINLNNCDEYGFYKLTEEVVIINRNRKKFECRIESGFPLETLKAIVLYKRKRNESNDSIDLHKIEEYAKRKNIKLGV